MPTAATSSWEAQFHLGNPKMARVRGPVFKRMPKHEGGGWYTDVETARLIAAAPAMLEALRFAATVIGHPDDDRSQFIAGVIAMAEGRI